MGGQEVIEAERPVAKTAAVFADEGVEGQALCGRLPHPLDVVYSLSAGSRAVWGGRRTRAGGGEGGSGRAHIGDDVEVADRN